MNILVYRPGRSKSALDLAAAVTALGHRASTSQVRQNDPAWTTVGWGYSGCNVNAEAGRLDKLQELQALALAGVSVPVVRLPSELSRADLRQTIAFGGSSSPLWLGRTPHHARARDLRRPRAVRREVAYYTQRLDIVEEFRCHVFRKPSRPSSECSENTPTRYVVARSGKKVMDSAPPSVASSRPASDPGSQSRPGARSTPGRSLSPTSAWIRSRLSGWLISYDGCVTTDPVRDLVKSAVSALSLDFGAVDIGVTRLGVPIVLEVNTAPSLDNPNTARVYAGRIARLCQEQNR